MVAVAFAVRAAVAWVVCGSVPLMSTALHYSEAGAHLLSHFPGSAPHYWPPGLPYCLAMVFSVFDASAWSARMVSVAASTLTVPLVVLIAAEVFDSERVSRCAGWIAALYPPALMLVGQPNTHHLAELLVAVVFLGLVVGVRTESMVLVAVSGLAAGLGCLTRPSMMVFLILAPVWLALSRTRRIRRRWFGAGVWFGAACAVIVPVAIYNAANGAQFTISTNNERNFFLGNNPHTPMYKTSHLAQRPQMRGLAPEVQEYLHSVYSSQNPRSAMRDEAVHYIIDHPVTTFRRTLARARSYWGFDYLASRQFQDHFGLSNAQLAVLLVFEAGGYLVVMVLAIFCVTVARGWRRQAACLSMVLLIGYMTPYVVVFSSGIYHFAVMCLVIPFAGCGLNAIRSSGWKLLAGRRGGFFIVAVLVLVMIQIEYAYHAVEHVVR